ncbi:hypothetical protein [Mycobacteroides abscessus]|uniref:hypothetical protein n=1 Tax=Mycobacteroides abscessus TaxID=36809 RepID=UPI00232BEA63|nr:hypothetical protein [Mycobacteroides abscessus]MDB2197159.1 hypothetical protein [Mycobacteroides abscessus subsp. abscessus]MDB2201981.1 hypothetical protein [Mycobacteroides abscessus subsp. abscessus]
MDEPQRRRLATRQEAYRLLRPHLVPLGAMALAADRNATRLTAAMLRNSDRARYEPKIRGLLVAVAWGEGVREWVNAARPPGVRLHTPYDWTELLIGELHVRIQRDTSRALNARRRLRNQQFPDPTLPFAVTLEGARIPDDVTNINVEATLSGDGRVRGIRAVAPYGKGFAWAAIEVDTAQLIRRLTSWERRQVPWLATVRQFAELALLDGLTAQPHKLLDELRDLQSQIAQLQDGLQNPQIPAVDGGDGDTPPPIDLPGSDADTPEEPRFRTPKKKQDGDDAAGDDV